MRNAGVIRRRAEFAAILQRQFRRERQQVGRPDRRKGDDQHQPVNFSEQRRDFDRGRFGDRGFGREGFVFCVLSLSLLMGKSGSIRLCQVKMELY